MKKNGNMKCKKKTKKQMYKLEKLSWIVYSVTLTYDLDF